MSLAAILPWQVPAKTLHEAEVAKKEGSVDQLRLSIDVPMLQALVTVVNKTVSCPRGAYIEGLAATSRHSNSR